MVRLRSEKPWPDNRPAEDAEITEEFSKALSVTRHCIQMDSRPEGAMVYMISIVNSGSRQYTGLTILDDLKEDGSVRPSSYQKGSLYYYINGVLQTCPSVTPGPPLMITGITVPAGGNAMIIYALQ